ncbi:PUA domain-containing protein [Halomarina pelagica]|uniref:PUA domain-containing protein n=1 Tax=Halomarina pelagica TaxID=2961599 RepID=UPI0020C1EDDB|nr:PUA domain-containing protein [Halomarina sp. BND7]
MDDDERARLRTIADYQFGAGAGAALFPDGEALAVWRSSTGRPQQVQTADETRLVSYGTDGRFTLAYAGGARLHDALGRPRVEVGEESVPFVRDGKNAFAKFVRHADADVRPGDEVLVTHAGALLAVGRAELPAAGMADFETGMAVKVRDGAGTGE